MNRCIAVTAGIALAVLGLSSCDPSPTAPRLDQLTLDVVSGDGQTAIVGTQVAPLIVRVTSGGNPVVQQVLNFRVVSGGGSVYGGTELTDNDGIAQELWTLGTRASELQKVEVRAVESTTGAAKVFATFNATALPDPAAQIAIGAGNQQTAHPLSSVPIAPAVQVTDQYGNPVPNVTVSFTPAGGSGSVTSGTPTTLANGTATVGSWTLGATCGSTNSLTATATGNGIAGNPATFTARVGDCWTTQASMPAGTIGGGAGVISGKLYVAAGGLANNCAQSQTLEVYDPASDTWTTGAQRPTARSALAAGVVNGILYVVGGQGPGCPGPILNTVEAYDPVANSWTTKAPMPTARDNLAVGVVNNVLYAVGGDNGSGCLATVEAYDPFADTWTTKAPMSAPRTGLTAAVVNSVLYGIGGNDCASQLTTVEAFDAVANAWTTRAPAPTARSGTVSGGLVGMVYVAGGGLNTLERYDPIANLWTTLTPMPTARNQPMAGVVNNAFYVVGGDGGGPTFLATNEAYHP